MPTFTPVDHDPFAAAPPAALPGAGGDTPGLRFTPVDHDPFAAPPGDTGDARPLTIRPGQVGPSPAPALPDQAAPPTALPRPPVVGQQPVVSAAQAGILSNSDDDGYVSGALKALGTAGIKGASHIVGQIGDLHDLARLLAAGAASTIDSRSAAEIMADMKARDDAEARANPFSTLNLPNSADVAAPVLARTGEYVSSSPLGRMAQAGAETAIGALGPGSGALHVAEGAVPAVTRSLLGATVPMGVVNAAAGAAGQGVGEVTQSPYAGLAAGLVAAPLAGGLLHVAGPLAAGARVFDPVPIVGPAIRDAVERKAGNALLATSSDPGALRDWASAPPGQSPVPNSPDTLAGTVRNDAGLFRAENDLRGAGSADFNARDRAKSDAQIAALRGIQPEGDVFAPGRMIRQRLDALDGAAQQAEQHLQAAHEEAVTGRSDALAARMSARGEAALDDAAVASAKRLATHETLVKSFANREAALRQTAQDATAALGPDVAPDQAGNALRTAIERVRSTVKGERDGLYRAIDPDGTLSVVATPLRDAKDAIAAGIDRYTGVRPSGAEAGLWSDIDRLPDVIPFRSLQTLDTRVTAAMADARRNPSASDPQALARLTQLKSGVMDAIHGAADNAAAYQARAVAEGRMAPEDTLEAAIRGEATGWYGGRAQSRGELASGVGGYAGTGSAVVPSAFGAQGASGRQPSFSPRDQGVSPVAGRGPSQATPNVAARPYVREVGVGPLPDPPFHDPSEMTRRPPAPDVPRPQSLADFIRRQGGMQDPHGDLAAMGLQKLVAKPGAGLPPDQMRLYAAEAGYLGGDTNQAMRETGISDLLNRLEDGGAGHSVFDEDAAHAWAQHDAARAAYDRGRADSEGRSRLGVLPEKAPLSAYSRDDIEGPQGAPAPELARSGLTPNFDRSAVDRIAAAKTAHAAYVRTYRGGPVAPGLRTNGFAGQYPMGDAAFLAGSFRPGPQGYEATKAYLDAARGDPTALAAIQGYATNFLRVKLNGAAMVTPKALNEWRTRFDGALRALDQAAPGWSDSFSSAAAATEALERAGVEHRAALDASDAEAARQAFLADKARKTDLGQANKADVARTRADDRATKAQTASRIGAVQDIAKAAHASPAGRFAETAGAAVAPAEVENAVGGMLSTGKSGPARMRSLVASVAGNPDALAGLRKAGIDYMLGKFVNDGTGEVAGARMLGFLRDNRDTLRELYPHDQFTTFGALAWDAEGAMKRRGAEVIDGGSDTAKGLLAVEGKAASSLAHLSFMTVLSEAVWHGFEHGGMAGAGQAAAIGGGAYLLNTLRSAGIARVSGLYREAMLDPAKARLFISKVTPQSEKVGHLAALIRRSTIMSPMVERAATP